MRPFSLLNCVSTMQVPMNYNMHINISLYAELQQALL